MALLTGFQQCTSHILSCFSSLLRLFSYIAYCVNSDFSNVVQKSMVKALAEADDHEVVKEVQVTDYQLKSYAKN